MKQLAIWIFELIECLILLMVKFIKVLGGKIKADSALGGGGVIKIPENAPHIKGTEPPQPLVWEFGISCLSCKGKNIGL